ncbi:MAG: aldo/keto reductase [Verrucomicrobia bacterium]|nr:aldo/keto reductase [Verrucomicrobiota bacterium]MCH8511903.1 aldo/keto reductase [Kiritimatiellia bacterium]
MKKHPFGNTDIQISPLGIGCTDNVEVIELLLDAGCNLLDTAQCYGAHEAFLGEHFRHRRDEFFLQSKCGHHEVLPDGSMRSLKITMADIDAALRKLRTDHLDAMLLHSYDLDALQRGDAIEVLQAAKAAGKIRFAGYSGDNERALFAARHGAFDVIETSISIADQTQIDTLLPLCREKGIGVVAKRPVANAAWRGFEDLKQVAAKASVYTQRLAEMNLYLPAFGFTDDNAGWSELALRFNLSLDGLHSSIIGTKNPAHARANLAVVEKGPLPPEVLQQIRDAFHRAEAASGRVWLGEN